MEALKLTPVPEVGSVSPRLMTAMVQDEYGTADVMRVEEVALPVPKADEVLVRVRAAAVIQGDIHMTTGKPYLIRLFGFGIRKPAFAIPGMCFAGEVESVGDEITRFRPGDAVFGEVKSGAFAEYVCAPEKLIASKPANMTYEEAATVPDAATTALQGLRDSGRVRAGQSVLINGASGGVGTYAVQIAKHLGAEVTAVCSGDSADMVRRLGADHIIDYKREDFVAAGKQYDAIFDLVGSRTLSEYRSALKRDGTFISCSGHIEGDWVGPLAWMGSLFFASLFASQQMEMFITKPKAEDLEFLRQLAESNELVAVIDKVFPLADGPEAIRYKAAGHARGRSVITM